MRRFLTILLFSLLLFPLRGQEMTVKSFVVKTTDLSASTQQRKDNNDTPCALVKVQMATAGAQFEPYVIGTVAYKVNEYWVYLPAGSKHLKVKHPNFLTKDVVFETYGVRSLESKMTYELVIEIPSGTPAQQVATSQYLMFQVEPKDAMITVNGEVWNNTDGVARKFVPFGTYQYRIEAKMYHPETGSVEVNDPNNKTQVSAQLKPSFGYIKIPKDGGLEGATIYIDKEIVGKAPLTSEPLASGQHTVMAVKPLYRSSEQTVTVQDGQTLSVAPVLTADYATVTFQVANQAEIWVNGERKGVGEWSGDLAAGDYMVETRLDRHRTVAVTKHISSDRRQQTLRLDAPTPICGGLNVSTTPDMADVYVDDQLSGQTPLFLQQCLIGEHQVRVSKANFGDYVTKVNVQEGQIAEVSGALSNLAGVQLSCNAPAAQVFVDGVSRGSLSGVTQLGYGKHELALQAEGFNDYSATIEVSASQRKFSFTMQPKQGEKQTFTVKGVTFTLIQVKGGTFQMGATAEQKNAYGDEKPVRAVTLSNYYIAESEVTQALWQAVMGTNPSNFKGDNRPVERVSWDDCQVFLQKLNALTGRQFRLPSEAEWEYAARGGSKSKHYIYSGSNMSGEVAYTVENSSFQTHDVKSKRPNELGLYDMSGNVFEWCQDWKGTYSAKAETDPKGPSSGTARVFRGGSWFQEGGSARVAIRGFHTPTSKLSYVGLRLAL